MRQELAEAGLSVHVPRDMRYDLWNKFLMIVSFGGLTTLARATLGEILESPELTAAFRDILAEVIDRDHPVRVTKRRNCIGGVVDRLSWHEALHYTPRHGKTLGGTTQPPRPARGKNQRSGSRGKQARHRQLSICG